MVGRDGDHQPRRKFGTKPKKSNSTGDGMGLSRRACLVAPGGLVIGDDDGLVSLSPLIVRTRIADAEAKLARETGWISALASGKSAAEVFGLAPAVPA